jgi:glycosyltransferase involved in cell wall biosynthesis
MFITVIIPTYRDWKRLSLCLKALEHQVYDNQMFEIIIVNNDPGDAQPHDFYLPTNCRIVSELKKGSYAARNAGIAIAKGEIIAFTDSDCIPDANWLATAIELFHTHPQAKRIGGKINLFYKSNERNAAELYESVYAFRQDLSINLGKSVTANTITYKYLFDPNNVGLFNENLSSGGDIEWSLRAQNKGFKIYYGDNVIVNHPSRDSFEELVKKTKRIAENVKEKSIVQKLEILKFLIPPVRTLSWSKGKPINVRVKVLAIKYYLNIIRFAESLKILIG